MCPALAVVSGVLAALSLPPFEVDWLMWLAWVPLFVALEVTSDGWCAFLLGVAGSLPLFVGVGFGLVPFSVCLAIIFPAVLAVLVGGVATARAVTRGGGVAGVLGALVLPSAWVVAEHAGTTLGIPWGIALSQSERLLVIQSASVLGMLWVSFLIILVNAAVAQASIALWRRQLPDLRGAFPAIAAVAASLAYGAWSLAQPAAPDAWLRVASIQPMLPSEVYTYQWLNPDYRRVAVDVVRELSNQAASAHPDLLVWPENGNGQYNFRIPLRRAEVTALARRSGASLLLSSYDAAEDGRIYNAVFSVSPAGALLSRYAKVRLASVGEVGFTPGSTVAPLATAHGPIGVMVCLESTLSWMARALVAQGATLLAVTTSDVAMRASAPPLHHERFAVFRAVENRRWLVQASNGGSSFVVSPWGAVTARTPFLTRTILSTEVGTSHERTLYTRFGDTPLLALACVVLAAALVRAHRGVAPPRVVRVPKTRAVLVAVPLGALMGLAVGFVSLSAIEARRGDARVPLAALVREFVTPAAPVVPADAGHEFRQASRDASGPAALAYVLQVLGVDLRPTELGLKTIGTSPGLADLLPLVSARGLRAWAVHRSLEGIRSVAKPVVGRLRDERYVVVLAMGSGQVDVFDPLAGFQRVPEHELAERWTGDVLMVRFLPLDRNVAAGGAEAGGGRG